MGCKCSKRGCMICDNRKFRKRAVREAKAAGRTVPYDMRTLLEDGHSPATIRAVFRSQGRTVPRQGKESDV